MAISRTSLVALILVVCAVAFGVNYLGYHSKDIEDKINLLQQSVEGHKEQIRHMKAENDELLQYSNWLIQQINQMNHTLQILRDNATAPLSGIAEFIQKYATIEHKLIQFTRTVS